MGRKIGTHEIRGVNKRSDEDVVGALGSVWKRLSAVTVNPGAVVAKCCHLSLSLRPAAAT